MLFGSLLLGSASVVALSFTDSAVDATNLTTYTFTAKNIGAAASNRKVVIGVFGITGGSTAVSSLTVGGVSAGQVVASYTSGSAEGTGALWIADVPSGTTGDVVVTFAGGALSCGIGVWALYGAAASVTDSGLSTTDPMTDTLNVSAGGAVIALAGAITVTATYTWTNVTENFDGAVEGAETYSGASITTSSAGTLAVTATPTGGPAQRVGIFASWGPA